MISFTGEKDGVRVAAVQMVSGPDVMANIETARTLVVQAKNLGARLVVLPEYFPVMGMKDTDKLLVSESFGTGPIQDFLSQTARSSQLWIVGGTLPIKAATPDRVRNSCLVFDDQGVLRARYDKIHLFGMDFGGECYRESDTIESGRDIVALDSPFGRIGLSICYDLRFPELYRQMGEVDILCIPSAFTELTGQAHWEVLLRARAIENLAYVIASGQGGIHPSGRETHGNSMIVDPWGVVVKRLGKGPGLVLADLSAERRQRLREGLPALKHKILLM
ncbi:MAG TPA: carbon-nitrogen hydrolase family protein [Burkholderiales bacterium]|nr:carbon-nitrogen hydrolase family protein [Burkholderiales bacterium]